MGSILVIPRRYEKSEPAADPLPAPTYMLLSYANFTAY